MNVPGQACRHPGCLSHISHPCEICGRIGGRTLTPDEVIAVAVLREISERGCSSEITTCRADGKYGELFQGIRRVVDRVLAPIMAEKAVLRDAMDKHKHTDECLQYAATTGYAHCIAKCFDSHQAALSSEPTGKVLVSVEQLKEIEWNAAITKNEERWAACPCCGAIAPNEDEPSNHADTCWLGNHLKESE